MDWCHFGALGASVGLLLLWTRRLVEKADWGCGKLFSLCKFRCVDDQYKSMFQVPMVPILSMTDMGVWWSLGRYFDMIPFEK